MSTQKPSRGRGGRGKAVRARGRGHGMGKPADFSTASSRELIGASSTDEEERQKALEEKYGKRKILSTSNRYDDPPQDDDDDADPDAGSEGTETLLIVERQKLRLQQGDIPLKPPSDVMIDEVDHTLDLLGTNRQSRGYQSAAKLKGQAEQIEWTREMEDMQRGKEEADATRALKTRLRNDKQDGIKQDPQMLFSSRRYRAEGGKSQAHTLGALTNEPASESYLDQLLN